MPKIGKVRTSVWVDLRLVLLLNERGLTLSSFLSRSLPMFLELPEDPREKLIQKRLDDMVLRLRSTYEREIKEMVRDFSAQQELEIESKNMKEKRDSLLLNLGEILQELNIYPQLERDLMQKDMESDLWDTALALVNSKSGTQYDLGTLWNTSLEWFKVYGMKKKA